MPRKRNPNGFTTDEAQTATLIMTEGSLGCQKFPRRRNKKIDIYRYPTITIMMCDPHPLEPAARVLERKIGADKRRRVICPPELFPPEGKGIWRIIQTGRKAQRIMQRLDPLLSPHVKQRWQKLQQTCR